MLIDLKPESVDDITRANLEQMVSFFKSDLLKERPNVFHKDPVKDKKEIRRYVKAFNSVIKYFKEP